MSSKYISEKEFSDFQKNFHLLVHTLNHNITDIKNHTEKLAENMDGFKEDFLDIKNYVKSSRKVRNWILGVFATILSGISIASFINFCD